MAPNKLLAVLLAIAAIGAATPVAVPAPQMSGFGIPTSSGGLGSDTASDVTDKSGCKKVTYIFARGTTEPGNMGTTVGPALQSALQSQLGANNVATQGVNYAADINGAIMGSLSPKDADGSKNMASLTKQALSQCPKTQIVLAGYSQGAQQVHGCLMDLEDAQIQKIAVAVTFGDPLSTTKFQGISSDRTKVYCAAGDLVCDDEFIITAAHLSYASTDATPAAEFVKSKVQ
ncbi:carbohydrate esterase family 5 protein [Saccharata proteae CBS 121410]|uniref:cutinase n=1 Tax=Saccharata proteae CBS 121410 TaxID=1314787 RepID=A0A9P4LY66_9PEZI|nr:carbohydrate esterase family 5 protein [Saccharata proteae CBS 121410]